MASDGDFDERLTSRGGISRGVVAAPADDDERFKSPNLDAIDRRGASRLYVSAAAM
jgi:hypothetical protein